MICMALILAVSFTPAYGSEEENDDYITGYVLKQEILEKLAQDKFNIKLKDLARPILSFNEDESVSNIWEKLLEKKEHISVIIDEYGSMRGIVTMEDVIETMLGFEIVDEKDEVVDMQELAKEQWQQVQNRQMARAKRLNAKKTEAKGGKWRIKNEECILLCTLDELLSFFILHFNSSFFILHS